MTTDTKQTALQITRGLYWGAVASSLLVGVLVVLPFYLYGIPAKGAVTFRSMT